MSSFWKDLIGDRGFYKSLFSIAGPIMLQNLLISSLSFIDTLMIGQLGSVQIAAVGLANQIFFVTVLFFFGLGSGASIFIAQFWGKKDLKSIHASMGIALTAAMTGALIISSFTLLFPERVMGIFTSDPLVIAEGVSYLQIVAVSYVFTSISFICATSLRSTERAKYPLISTSISLTTNVILNYLLIFGNFGFPAMGVAGAALATAISRGLDMVLVVAIAYRLKTPIAAPIKQYFQFDRAFVKKYFRTVLPVLLNEMAWSLGMVAYKMVYARMGTDVIASANVSEAIQSLFFVIYIGTGNASAVMIGKKIGQQRYDMAMLYAKRFLILPIFMGLCIGTVMAVFAPMITLAYNLEPEIMEITRRSLRMLAVLIPIRGLTIHAIIGVLRSGGDTRYSLFLEATGIWGIGVPLAVLGGLVLNLPIYFVYLMIGTEELYKGLMSLARFKSGRWLNDLTEEPPVAQSQILNTTGTEIP